MRPHDLIRVRDPAPLCERGAPDWVGAALGAAPFVVVRRARRDGAIAVGIRGATRDQRHAAWLAPDNVGALVTPELLVATRAWQRVPAARQAPAFSALHRVAGLAADFVWGPAGAVGFELATGMEVVHAESDLDLIVRPRPGDTYDDLARFARSLAKMPARIDVVLEAVNGAAALDEYLRDPGHTLIKTADGPLMGALQW